MSKRKLRPKLTIYRGCYAGPRIPIVQEVVRKNGVEIELIFFVLR